MNRTNKTYFLIIVNGQAVAYFRNLSEAIRASADIATNRPGVSCRVERA